MAKWRRQDNPPPPGPTHEIIRIKGVARRMFWILSPSIEGFPTHWDSKHQRTIACENVDGQECLGCKAEFPSRWKGYLCVLDTQKGKVGFLELTPAGAQQIERQTTKGAELRGLVIAVWRTSESNGARLVISVESYTKDESLLPPPREAEPHLRALWK